AEYVGMKNFVAVCKSMAEDLLVDVDLHLDHANHLMRSKKQSTPAIRQ
ncbi:hypothetical protein AAULR_03069, partial [Lacticaseibacillus rhamnosus MTCC 5462]